MIFPAASGQYKVTRNRLPRESDNSKFPIADDKVDHNSYFGMSFSVAFELDKDYQGPLEYYFFGDDDMWVYLDNQLVCDIGGVHVSYGEYVDLWKYLPKERTGDKEPHTLRFFYTERGASGSTCYMRFTLPSVTSVTPNQETAKLLISKEVLGVKTDEEYKFKIRFYEDETDESLFKDDYAYSKFQDGELIDTDLYIHDNGEFTLKDGQHIEILYLPFGTRFEIEEIAVPGVGTTSSTDATNGNGNGRLVTGVISNKETDQIVNVRYTNIISYELPKTGGSEFNYESIGLSLAAVSLICIVFKKRKTKFDDMKLD